MTEFAVSAATALWLGILTSISPCPLATNIAAISYVGQRVGKARQIFLSGLLYTLGRTLAYLGLAVVLLTSVLSVPQVSIFLQKYMHIVLGPILIVVGMFLLRLIEFSFGGSGMSEKLQQRIDALGIWGALPLGMVFALSFCPTSAWWFFGSLIPLSLNANSSTVLPCLYGVGTALPVLVFALLLALSTQSVVKAYNVFSKVEWWARIITGWVFIAIGVYFSLKYIFEVF